MSQTRPEIVDDIFADEPAAVVETARRQGTEVKLTVVPKAQPEEPADKASPSLPRHSHIAGDVTFKGTLTSKGEITIEGQFQGTLAGDAVTICEQGTMLGDVIAEEVTVLGRVQGVLRCTSVTLGPGSHVLGDIHYRRLSVDGGARFEGRSCFSENPQAQDRAPSEARAAAAPSANTNEPLNYKDFVA